MISFTPKNLKRIRLGTLKRREKQAQDAIQFADTPDELAKAQDALNNVLAEKKRRKKEHEDLVHANRLAYDMPDCGIRR